MRYAAYYKITTPIALYMRTISHREYLTRLAWIDEQWNQPDRTDHYLMQVAVEIRRVRQMFRKNPQQVKLEEAQIPFEKKKVIPVSAEAQQENAAKLSKSVWAGRFGIPVSEIEKQTKTLDLEAIRKHTQAQIAKRRQQQGLSNG